MGFVDAMAKPHYALTAFHLISDYSFGILNRANLVKQSVYLRGRPSMEWPKQCAYGSNN
jgi:hypothetical protein